MVEWVKNLEGNGSPRDKKTFTDLAEVFHLSGKQLFIMWKGDVDKRVVAAGGTEGDADFIYTKFRELVAAAKKKARGTTKVARKLPPGPAFGGGENKGVAASDDGAGGDVVLEGPKKGAALIYGGGLSSACVENSGK